MLVRISSMVLRIAALLALILGLLFWFNAAPDALIPVHMLLGIIVVITLWLLAYAIATAPQGRNVGLAAGAAVLGLLLVIVGVTQNGALALSDSAHWVIQVIHLLLGLGSIGIGEAITGRYRRANKVNEQVQG